MRQCEVIFSTTFQNLQGHLIKTQAEGWWTLVLGVADDPGLFREINSHEGISYGSKCLSRSVEEIIGKFIFQAVFPVYPVGIVIVHSVNQ